LHQLAKTPRADLLAFIVAFKGEAVGVVRRVIDDFFIAQTLIINLNDENFPFLLATYGI
jgi:hypothetical protein